MKHNNRFYFKMDLFLFHFKKIHPQLSLLHFRSNRTVKPITVICGTRNVLHFKQHTSLNPDFFTQIMDDSERHFCLKSNIKIIIMPFSWKKHHAPHFSLLYKSIHYISSSQVSNFTRHRLN